MNYSKIISFKLHYLVVISAIMIVTYCAPLSKESEAQISNSKYTNDGRGNYFFRFSTTNGITREETGTVVNKGLPNEHVSVTGTYSYINSDGITEMFSYTADENGFLVTPESAEYDMPIFENAVVASLLGK